MLLIEASGNGVPTVRLKRPEVSKVAVGARCHTCARSLRLPALQSICHRGRHRKNGCVVWGALNEISIVAFTPGDIANERRRRLGLPHNGIADISAQHQAGSCARFRRYDKHLGHDLVAIHLLSIFFVEVADEAAVDAGEGVSITHLLLTA